MPVIIDCHIHVGNWNTPIYQHRNAVCSKQHYEKTWPMFIGIFMPSDQRDNDNPELVAAKYRWWWFDPHSMELPDRLPANVVGYKIHSGIDRVMNGVCSELYEDMMKHAAELDIPILVHCGNWEDTSSYEWLKIAAMHHPKNRFIAAHCGGGGEPKMYKAITAFKNFGNIAVDTSSVKYPGVIEHAIATLGATRVLFGSDWPIMSPLAAMQTHLAIPGLSDYTKNRIEHVNAQNWILNGTEK